jgi:hypothetical protein
MDWMRENKTLAAIIGVMVAGGLGLAAVLAMSYFQYTASLEEFQSVSNRVATLKGAKLYPSEENVTAKEAAISEYEEEVSKLGSVLLALQQPVKPLSDTEFQARLKARIADTRQKAEGRTPAPVTLPKDFAFGFDSYTASLPRSAEAAMQLGDYLGAVDDIVNMLITSGVSSIDSIERTDLDVEKGKPPPPPEPPKETRKSPTRKSTKGKATEKKAAPVKEIAKVVERRTVKLVLTTDQGPLQVVMNKLASPSEMVHFTIVRQLRVENEKQEGPLRGSLPKLGDSASAGEAAPADPSEPVDPAKPAAAAVPAKTQVIEPAKPAAPDAQAVFGEERLRVYMEIDLVRFLEPSPAEDGAAK